MVIRTDDLVKETHIDKPRPSEAVRTEDIFDTAFLDQAEPNAGDGASSQEVIDRLVNRYVERAMLRVQTKQYDDGKWFAEIPALSDVWGSGSREDEAVSDLDGGLRDWLEAKMLKRDGTIPVIDSINLNVL